MIGGGSMHVHTKFCRIVGFHCLHNKRLPRALKKATHTLVNTSVLRILHYSHCCINSICSCGRDAYAAHCRRALQKALHQAQHLPPTIVPDESHTQINIYNSLMMHPRQQYSLYLTVMY